MTINWQEILQSIIYPALAGAITTAIGALVYRACDAISRWASSFKHGQAVGIVADAIKAAWTSKIKPSLAAKLADGKITDEEWHLLQEDVKEAARQIANDRLKDLRGFAPKSLGQWVEVQLDAALGEYLGGMLIGEESDPLANAPASED